MPRAVRQGKEVTGSPIGQICGLLGISRQMYYRRNWRKEKCQESASEVMRVVDGIRLEMPRIGTRKVYYLCRDKFRAMHVGRDKLNRILKANHLLQKPQRSYHVTTNSHHRFHVHKNLVENLDISRPEQVWVSDITYIDSRQNNLYLALVTDAYSKRIMGYDLSKSLDTQGALRALSMANRNRDYPEKLLIHHSDRGIQYCSDIYQKRLRRYGILTSMTEKYDPYANAVAERVNGILKQEFQLENLNLDIQQMKNVVKDAISIYNSKRPHCSCEMLTPMQMHAQCDVRIKTYKKENHNKVDLAVIP